MKRRMLLVGVLATVAAQGGLANTATDNVAWSARSVEANSAAPECSAYGRSPIANKSPESDSVGHALKVAGTIAATAALSTVAHYGGAAPNPCRSIRP
ncbi:hypothetical protein LMG31841_00530 [Paraburkholderia saeva]|uniref:Uncharacterized protein n=1 Tax=Paraburkholderia saeva TaxID=2777537 RepID=A0A9N8RS18_9BURK|nr:hypothetical protein LMG31841_00530 [Paraburkholderia saeva]CAG4901795.1 hypothetical protein R70241_02904 [Paraburkholderia saeva]